MSGENNAGAARLVFGDATIVFLPLKEVRHRIVARVFGISRKNANVMTGAAVVLAAAGAQAGATWPRRVRLRPTGTETAFGAIALKETAHGIAGDWSRGTPLFATLVILVVLKRSFGPALRGSPRSVRSSLHGVRATWRGVRAVLEGK